MVTLPTPGQEDWGAPLNSALADLDERITTSAAGTLQAADNLSDLTNPGAARINLELGDAARANIGTAAGEVAPASEITRLDNTLGTFSARVLPDPATADAVSPVTVPTPVLTPGLTSTIASAQQFTPDSGVFSYTGEMAFGVAYPDTFLYQNVARWDYSQGSPPVYAVEFMTDAQTFEIMFKHLTTVGTRYRLSIDGRKVSDQMLVTGSTVAGDLYVLKFNLGSSAVRRIRFDFTYLSWGGVFVGANDSVWKAPFQRERLMVVGDSIADGSNMNNGYAMGTWAHRFGRLLDYGDLWNHSLGGTGYVNAADKVTFGARLQADVIDHAPERIIMAGGYNDAAFSSQVAAAAGSVFSTLRTGLPSSYVLVLGCYSQTAVASGGKQAVDAALKAQAALAGFPFYSPITGKVYDASGTEIADTGPWITAANIPRFVGTDTVHPTDAGHTYIAHRIAQAYRLLGNP